MSGKHKASFRIAELEAENSKLTTRNIVLDVNGADLLDALGVISKDAESSKDKEVGRNPMIRGVSSETQKKYNLLFRIKAAIANHEKGADK